MKKTEKNFIPALSFHWATRFYDPLVRRTTKEYSFKRALIEQANLDESQTILDLACGTGTLSIGIKRRFPEIEIFAVDADEEVLKMAKKKASERGGLHIHFRQSFSDELPFENNSFDRVFSTLSFHHLTLEVKIKTIAEIKRILKPEGEFHLADFGKPANNLQNILSKLISLIDGKETTKDNLEGRLGLLLKENGFEYVERTGNFKTVLGTIRMFKAVKKSA